MPNKPKPGNMNWKSFFAHTIGSLMWPAVILVFLFTFRAVIEEKIRQADQMRFAGMLEFAFPLAEKAIEDQEMLADILTDGISSDEEMRKVNRIATASSVYASLISKAGLEGEAVHIAEKNRDVSQQILRDVVQIKQAEEKTNLSIEDIGRLKEEIAMLEQIGVDPEKIDSDEAADKISKASRSADMPAHRKERLKTFAGKGEREDFRRKMNSLDKAQIDPRAISFHRIDPRVLEKVDRRSLEMSVEQKTMPSPK